VPMIHFESKEKVLRIDEIFKDDSIYPRERTDDKRIDFFSDLIEEGTRFPPIKIVKDTSGRYILIDGFHRYSAFIKLKRTEIACDLIDAAPQLWRLLSVGFNSDSSQPLKPGEIKRAIHDAWCKDNVRNKRQIADMVGCSVQWVRKVVKGLAQKEESEKLALARKLKDEENLPVRDIAERIGWSKTKTHRLLSEDSKTENGPENNPADSGRSSKQKPRMTSTETPPQTEPSFQDAENVIRNFDRYDHEWEPDQKETLYVFDGIKNNIPVQVISDHINRGPGWVRNTASVLLLFYQNDEKRSDQLQDISDALSVDIDRIQSIHWFFIHWPSILPERHSLFQWILSNPPRYRDDRMSQLIRLEHLHWHNDSEDAQGLESDQDQHRHLSELPDDTLSRLNRISAHFEDLKRYLRNYDIDTALAKDLLERMNLIMILQNRIRDHLCKYI
jgi:hypothetical protein